MAPRALELSLLIISFLAPLCSPYISETTLAPFSQEENYPQITPGGPNVCRSKTSTYCCPGWTRHHQLALCIIPICSRTCGTGRCIQPNLCMCDNGEKSSSCIQHKTGRGQSGGCKAICMNNGTCVHGRCECADGYTGEFCTVPVCITPCKNAGRCIGPDRCSCMYGFTGAHCEIDYRAGPCYTGHRRNLCVNQLDGVLCTKILCCATVGKAWGRPCEHCPSRLECDTGYLKDQKSGDCIDINECEAIPHLCDGGECVNSVGSFDCKCRDGQARNLDTNKCDDRDECLEEGICEHGRCVNTNGGFYCMCHPGFIQSQDRRFCIDGRQGSCYTRRYADYDCSEPLSMRLSKRDCCCAMNIGKGWGENCDRCPEHGEDAHRELCYGRSAVTPSPGGGKTGENYTWPDGPPGGGNNRGGGHRHPIPSSSRILVNECIMRPDQCGLGGRCIDLDNGYECECKPGYRNLGDQKSDVCEDINECREGKCQNGRCDNTPGSFKCDCPSGFDLSPDGTMCTDHDECKEIGMCTNGICTNMDGSYKCNCKNGYKLSATGFACIDNDECYENPKICLNGRCENTQGSYTCICQLGFVESSDKSYCLDRDECENKHMCSFGKCVNMEGTFKCVCDVGYKQSPDGHHCVDINECDLYPCQHGSCYNTQGSFRCECFPGFSLGPDGRTCLDTRKDLCYQHYKDGQCLNPSSTAITKSSCCCCTVVTGQPMGWGTICQPCPLIGTSEFDQLCPHGSGSTFDGTDINECAQNKYICENGACENLMGTYRCICNPGYKPDDSGKKCIDINECEEGESVCYGGQCRNSPGSFKCDCPSGTKQTQNFMCEDVDECIELGPETCFNGNCINTHGSYKCECPDGWILDSAGRVCLDNRKASCWRTRHSHGGCENSLPLPSRRVECCCSVGMAWGSPCEACNRNECECARGYAKLDGKQCTDVNECELDANICRGGGTCVNTDGSYTCACPPALTLDPSRSQCLDMRQEQCYTRYKHGKCLSPLDGKFARNLCCCSSFGKGWGDKCEPCPRPGTSAFIELCPKGPGFIEKKDINECTDFQGMCQNGRCRNTVGSYNCQCRKGFAYDENRIKCIDIDECSITTTNVCGKGICQNTDGSFTCICDTGYRITPPMQVCMDINECAENIALCRGGQCVNTEGSYHCDCPEGLELSVDKESCKDIDECSRTSGICSNGVCENLLGTYQCTCNDGYAQSNNRTHCADINECEDEPCSDICHNIPGSFSCSCGQGYSLQPDGTTCVDVDECKENPRICSNGNCINKEGTYECICTTGLEPGKDSKSCLDINECLLQPHICGNGVCTNKHGSYECSCDEGYSVKPDGPNICTDDNECDLTYQCDVNADCINIPGSYQCRCHDGFTGNGVSCRDVNECLHNNGGCDANAQCINTDGSFRCVCDTGFRGDGYRCQDIDECENDVTLCDNGQCLNLPGSFQCECEMGFMHPGEKDDQSCKDIDECTMFHNLCVFGACENTHGMFRCECNEGYKPDGSGGNCTDIDECDSPEACRYGKCTNMDGSYKCSCPVNHDLVEEGNGCIDRRTSRCYLHVDHHRKCEEPISDYVTKGACCCSVGRAWGPNCEFCPSKDSAEYQTLCPGGIGFKLHNVTVVLDDIDECQEHKDLCVNGHCSNTYGSFMCSCDEGYRLDNSGALCVDINECTEDPHICNIGECVNEPGRYYCRCPDGYMARQGNRECVDMRKEFCFLEYHRWECSSPMSEPLTKMLCCCSMGQAWGQPCEACPQIGTNEHTQLCGIKPGKFTDPMTNISVEIDECSMMQNMCGHHGRCINTPGSFDCECHSGYVYDIGSHQCIDDNECARTPNPCEGNAQCVNLGGRFECKCPDGYKYGATRMDCVDVDECAERRYSICANGDCKNFQGSFQCLCHTGYQLAPSRDTCLDIDECQRPGICDDGVCMNLIGSYKCLCNAGFMLSQGNQCVDLDECHMMALCRHGRCRNIIGSFTCECLDGYTLTPDGNHCRDVDECTEVPGTCPAPGTCINLMGSYTCSCPAGYELSKVTRICEDMDECAPPGACEYGECMNTMGGAYCNCPPGYVLDADGFRCVDVRREQCYDHFFNRYCSEPRQGVSIMRKECCCSRGAAWGKYCEECPREGTDAFFRLCPEGLGRMETGQDIDECALMPDVCDGGECVNTDGSFRCVCPEGYVLDNTGKRCIDDNECLATGGAGATTGRNICGNGTCTNVPGSFECQCGDGFAPGPNQICEDINECIEIGHHCVFRCHNVPGSYRCFCPYGYTLAPDGRHCDDLDECQTPSNNCKFLCKNLIGSFMCLCPDGYAQVNNTDDCRDIDECAINPHSCGNHGRCVNTPGSFQCVCADGFEPSHDRKSCIDKRLGSCFQHSFRCDHTRARPAAPIDRELRNVTKADCCCTMGEAWGPYCEACPRKYSPDYKELCLELGYTITGDDVDECSIIPDLCRNGDCINTSGSYRCRCHKGFRADPTGLYCHDINECESRPTPCKGSCQNTQGSFICSCPVGYRLLSDGISCQDIDECATGYYTCQHNCVNTEGSYECTCRPGYKAVGDECLDINECDLGKCPKPGRCVNTMGSFRCICPRGFKLDSTGSYCTDADECLDDTNCEEGCVNTIGGYKCGCPDGFKLHHYYNHCVDENECLNSPCGGNGNCVNTQGSYRCGCADGYQFDTRTNVCLQMSSGCAGAPCSFGCSPTSTGGFSCGCPQGYKSIGYGHCLATIGGYGPDIGNVPTYPIGENGQQLDDKIIGTEQCFSCKINGRHRRDSKHLRRRLAASTEVTDIRQLLLKRSPAARGNWRSRSRRHQHGQYLDIKISLEQTRHKTRLVKIQPAIKGDMEYAIVRGNEQNKFTLKRKQDVWVLHFRKRLKRPGVFNLVLHGRQPTLAPAATATTTSTSMQSTTVESPDVAAAISDTYEQPLILHIRLSVTE